MTCNVQTLTKSFVVAAALAASVSGLAYADEGGALGGPSEAQLQAAASDGPAWHPSQSAYDESRSAWRQSNPDGLSVREMQSMWGTWAGQFRLNQPTFTSASTDASFKQSHPNGMTAREYQAMSSDAPAWQLPTQPANAPLASTGGRSGPTSATN
jgi:hypothetical protein